jgi:PAS domain S-box-containing protein
MTDKLDTERFRSAFENVPFGIAIASPEGRLVAVNPALLGMLGCAREEALHLSFTDIAHPDDRENTRRLYRQIRDGGISSFRCPMRFIARDGRTRWADVRAAGLRGEKDEIQGFFAILEDITGRVEAEKQRDCDTGRTLQARDTEADETPARAAIHELNNALQAIQGSVSLLLFEKAAGHPDLPYLKRIDASVARATGLTRRLLGSAPGGGADAKPGGFRDAAGSETGQGPSAPARPEAAEEAAAPRREPAPGDGPLGPLTILLVEDEEIAAEISEQMLIRLGHRVLTAKNGAQALSVYEDNRDRIDLVILDMVMPGMGGGDVFDRLREINPQAAVILSSGYSLNGPAREILQRGCRGFIQKPFSMDALARKLRELFSSGRRRA